MIRVAVFLVILATMACGSSAATSEHDSSASPQLPKKPTPVLLLSEESAISILQTFLQECVLGWDIVYANYARGMAYQKRDAQQIPPSAQERKSWLMDLANGTIGDFTWSAGYHGVTDVPRNVYMSKAETWVVIGPGLERAGSQLVVPGRWRVYAGIDNAYYLDAPARLALDDYRKGWWLTAPKPKRGKGSPSCY